MLIAFCSFKQAPGVSTTALGLSRCWPRPVLLADLDPAGGDLTDTLTASKPQAAGLQDSLLALRRVNDAERAAADVWHNASPLTAGQELRLLPGLDDPGQTTALRDGWQALAGALAAFSTRDEPADVLADCGRLSADSPAWPVLCAADIVVPVVLSTAAGVRRAAHGLRMLTDRLISERSAAQLQLLVRQAGPYAAQDIADALDVPLLAELPDDAAGVGRLAAGSPRRVSRTRLWRQLATTARQLSATAPQAAAAAHDVAEADTAADPDIQAVDSLHQSAADATEESQATRSSRDRRTVGAA